MQLAFILWNANPSVLNSFGIDAGFDFRWYGILFASGFVFGQLIIAYIFNAEGKPAKDVEALTMYALIGTVLGARLGHCLFYEPSIYLADPIKILYIWEGGLASHGAAVAIMISIWLYSRKRPGQSFLWVIDRVVITVALGGALIRMGNLANSEIIGKPTDLPTGFVFARSGYDAIERPYGSKIENLTIAPNGKDTTIDGQPLMGLTFNFSIEKGSVPEETVNSLTSTVFPSQLQNNVEAIEHFKVIYQNLNPVVETKDGAYQGSFQVYGIPRHPSQLYESISTFLTFIFLFYLWFRNKDKTPEGLLFSLFVIINFSLRFLYEFSKEPQVAFENSMSLNMGQLLSIPLVLIGIFTLWLVLSKQKKNA